MRIVLFLTGTVLLIAVEILKVYFIIPFPHSQAAGYLGLTYFINMHIWWLRIAGFIIVAYPLWQLLYKSRAWQKILAGVAAGLYITALYLCNFQYVAGRIFAELKEKQFTSADDALRHSGQLVIGVIYNGEAKAYPVSVVAYHHQVKDTVGGQPLIITYCSFCRTGRVYTPFINGKYTRFRLVGMSNFNSIFEDEATKSWWKQATGKAITGELKDARLTEVPSEVMYMGQWLAAHHKCQVMKPDRNFLQEYDAFNNGHLSIY
jgi:hypothetical protein